METQEILKKIKNFSRYFISNNGNIFYKDKNNDLKSISPIKNKSRGYLYVNLKDDDNKKRFIQIHRLVGLAYLKYINDKLVINHKDGNKQNNNIDNLEWLTDLENRKHAANNKLMKYGERHHFSKLSNIEVIDIKKFLKSKKFTHKEIAEKFKTTRANITKISLEYRWKHIN